MTDITNARRAHHAYRALDGYSRAKEGGTHGLYDEADTCLVDLLTDLQHYADSMGLDFEKCFSVARAHFDAEAFKPPTYTKTEDQSSELEDEIPKPPGLRDLVAMRMLPTVSRKMSETVEGVYTYLDECAQAFRYADAFLKARRSGIEEQGLFNQHQKWTIHGPQIDPALTRPTQVHLAMVKDSDNRVRTAGVYTDPDDAHREISELAYFSDIQKSWVNTVFTNEPIDPRFHDGTDLGNGDTQQQNSTKSYNDQPDLFGKDDGRPIYVVIGKNPAAVLPQLIGVYTSNEEANNAYMYPPAPYIHATKLSGFLNDHG